MQSTSRLHNLRHLEIPEGFRPLRHPIRLGGVQRHEGNPFENPSEWTIYEILKLVFLFPLALVRGFLAICLLLLMLIIACLALIGAPGIEEDNGCVYHSEPFPESRRAFITPLVYVVRLITILHGFFAVDIIDSRRDPSKTANIIVAAPHLTDLDMTFVWWVFDEILPAVGDRTIYNIPLVSSIALATQSIFVDLKSKESKDACKRAIKYRGSAAWEGPPLLIFPEGRITNGSCLIQFKTGAFNPGCPVQPVILRYPFDHYNPAGHSVANRSVVCGVCRMLTQFYNQVEVELLDVYEPSEEEKKNPILFANNVRKTMATALGISVTEHSYEDAFLFKQAMKAGVVPGFAVHDLEEHYSLDYAQLQELLKLFQKYDVDENGWISRDEFEQVVEDNIHQGGRTPIGSAELFDFFDSDGDGGIQYVEFVQAMTLISSDGLQNTRDRAILAFLLYCHGQGHQDYIVVDQLKGGPYQGYSPGQRLNHDEFQALALKYPHVVDAAFPPPSLLE